METKKKKKKEKKKEEILTMKIIVINAANAGMPIALEECDKWRPTTWLYRKDTKHSLNA